jgi:hypothetical protein
VNKLKGRPYFKASLCILAAGKVLIALLSTLLTTFLSLISMQDDSKDRPLSEGSNLFGEYNFRTGEMDSGGDPDGWYEEDM